MAGVTTGERASAAGAMVRRSPRDFGRYLVANVVSWNQEVSRSEREFQATAVRDEVPGFAVGTAQFINFCFQRVVGNALVLVLDIPLALGETALGIGVAALNGEATDKLVTEP